MTPTRFDEANTHFGPPPDLEESQCGTIPAFRGTVERGSCEGTPLVVVAWQPSPEDLAALQAGAPVFLTMLFDGLMPHMMSTNFHAATHPA